MSRTRTPHRADPYPRSEVRQGAPRPGTGLPLPPCLPAVVFPWVTSWSLPQHPTAAGQARRMTRQLLSSLGLSEHSDVAELLVSELVTNALTHGEGPIRLYLLRRHGTLRFAVSDHCDNGPQIRPLSPDSERGRGMRLLETLARGWGVQPMGRGKTVWAELATCAVRGCCL